MAHFIEKYADRFNDILHHAGGTRFYKQEIVEVPGLLTALLITYDGVRDDIREFHTHSWDQFLERMSAVKPDWRHFDRTNIERLNADQTLGGWENRIMYFIRSGSHPERWTTSHATEDAMLLLTSSVTMLGTIIQNEVEHLRDTVPPGREYFNDFEHMVRVIFNFLFRGKLGEGHSQSRTEPENEGVEIRDLIFTNMSETGFWKDLKDKYSSSEIVVDAKNTDELTRDDLRQLYCYLKPALGFWGFIVCRAKQPAWIHAFNRTLYKNFRQERGVLIICDEDLRRMVSIANHKNDPSKYLREMMSTFVRSI